MYNTLGPLLTLGNTDLNLGMGKPCALQSSAKDEPTPRVSVSIFSPSATLGEPLEIGSEPENVRFIITFFRSSHGALNVDETDS